jgi:serine/threonine protein kinase
VSLREPNVASPDHPAEPESSIDARDMITDGPGRCGESEPRNDRFQQVGRYIILDQLGKGGMGEVFRGYDPELHRRVAIKLFRGDEGGDLGTLVAQQRLNEARAIAKLSHPNIVPIYDVGIHEGAVYLALELIEGATLREQMRAANRPPSKTRLKWMVQCARALAAVHEAGLVHGDFKPENAIVGQDGLVRLLDFGLARASDMPARRALANSVGEHAESGSGRWGTLHYLSAQQICGAPSSRNSDRFAWGVTVYEMVALRRPFRGATHEDVLRDQSSTRYQSHPAFRRLDGRVRRMLVDVLQGGESCELDFSACADVLEAAMGKSGHKSMVWAGLTLALTAAVTMVLNQANEPETCAIDASPFAADWTPSRAEAVNRAFMATGLALAAPSFRRIDRELLAWQDSWLSAAQEYCHADHVRFAEDLSARNQASCLLATARTAQSLTRLLEHADKAMIEKVIHVVHDLPAPGKCMEVHGTNDSFLAGLPVDEEKRLRDAERELSKASQLASMGQAMAANQAFFQLRKSLEHVEWMPLLVKARAVEASLAFESWNHGAGWRIADQALVAAISTDRLSLVRQAAMAQANAAGYLIEDPDEIEEKVRMYSAIDRRANADLLDQARMQLAIMRFYLHADANERADLAGTRGIAVLDRLPGSPASQELRAQFLMNLGATRASMGRSHDGEEASLQSLRLIESSLGPEHPMLANPLWNLALANINTGMLGRAEVFARRGQMLLEGLDGPWTQRAVPFYHYRLDILRGFGLWKSAREMYVKVLPFYVKMFGVSHMRTFTMLADQALATMGAGRFREAYSQLVLLHDLAKKSAENIGTILRFVDLQLRTAIAGQHYAAVQKLVAYAEAAARKDAAILYPTWLWANLELARVRNDRAAITSWAEAIEQALDGALAGRFGDVGDCAFGALLRVDANAQAERLVARFAAIVLQDPASRDPRRVWLASWHARLALAAGDPARARLHLEDAVNLARGFEDELSPAQRLGLVFLARQIPATIPTKSETMRVTLNAMERSAQDEQENDVPVPEAFFEPLDRIIPIAH